MPGQVQLCVSFRLSKLISAGTLGQTLCIAPSWPLLVSNSYICILSVLGTTDTWRSQGVLSWNPRCELDFCPPFGLHSSTIPWPLQTRFTWTFKFSTSPSLPVSMRCSRAPLLFGFSKAWWTNCQLCSPGISWILYALLCRPCSRYWSEKGPQRGQGPETSGSYLSALGTFHFLLMIRKPGTDTVGLLYLPLPFTLTWLLCHPKEELRAHPQRAVALFCLLSHLSWRLMLQSSCVPVIQTRAQACKCTKLCSPAHTGVLISVKSHKKTSYSGGIIGFSASMVSMKVAHNHWTHYG